MGLGERLRRRQLRLGREDMLRSRPVRNMLVKWEREPGREVCLILPRKNKWWVNLIAKFFYVPDHRTVMLDEIGSWIWDLCDGNNTVANIATKLRDKHRLERKEAEVSTITYLRQLAERGIIGLAVPTKGGTKR